MKINVPLLTTSADTRLHVGERKQTHQPVKEEQYRQHGLVDVAVADPLVEQEAGVPHHRLQGVLPHDVVQLVCVQVLVHQLVAELAKVSDAGAGRARRQARC